MNLSPGETPGALPCTALQDASSVNPLAVGRGLERQEVSQRWPSLVQLLPCAASEPSHKTLSPASMAQCMALLLHRWHGAAHAWKKGEKEERAQLELALPSLSPISSNRVSKLLFLFQTGIKLSLSKHSSWPSVMFRDQLTSSLLCSLQNGLRRGNQPPGQAYHLR